MPANFEKIISFTNNRPEPLGNLFGLVLETYIDIRCLGVFDVKKGISRLFRHGVKSFFGHILKARDEASPFDLPD